MSHRLRLLALGVLTVGLLGFGVAWHATPASTGHRERAVKLAQIGNRRALRTLMRLDKLSVSPGQVRSDTVPANGRPAGLLEYSLARKHEGPLPSTDLGRQALGSEFDFDAVSLAFDPADWDDPETGLYANPLERGKRWERGACLSLFNAGRLAVETTVGMRIHGNTARRFHEKSVRLILNRLYGTTAGAADLLPGAKGDTLVVRNETRRFSFASPIAYELAALLGCDAPRTRPVRLLLNGVEQQGAYCLTEYLGSGLLRARLGHSQFIFANEPTGYGPKGYRKQYLRIRDHAPTTMQGIAEDIDLDDLINWLTTVLFCANWDCRQGLADRDEADPDGRWRWIVWDLDFAFRPWPRSVGSLTVEDRDITQYLLNNSGLRSLLFRRLLADDPAFRTRLLRRLSSALNHELRLPNLLAILTRYRAVASTYSEKTSRPIRAGLDEIEGFMRQRPARLRQELAEHLDAGPVHSVTLTVPAGVAKRVDGHQVVGPYTGHYFSGQTISVLLDGAPPSWRVNGQPAGNGSLLEIPVDGDLAIKAIAR